MTEHHGIAFFDHYSGFSSCAFCGFSAHFFGSFLTKCCLQYIYGRLIFIIFLTLWNSDRLYVKKWMHFILFSKKARNKNWKKKVGTGKKNENQIKRGKAGYHKPTWEYFHHSLALVGTEQVSVFSYYGSNLTIFRSFSSLLFVKKNEKYVSADHFSWMFCQPFS